MAHYDYDLFVIGAGSGGVRAARIAAGHGARVVIDVAGAITPVPGGVGPMTIACLLANTVTSFCRTEGLPDPNWVE